MLEDLEKYCTEVGTDISSIRRSVGVTVLLGDDESDLERNWRDLQKSWPEGPLSNFSFADYASSRLVGTPDEVVRRLRGWHELGVSHVVIAFGIEGGAAPLCALSERQLQTFADVVLPLSAQF
jgi:alkanesulfonate monooxygenase SsuD/methylene tetrahydromethanopterin reductase-like flavin-dependent oxidoreductase (luciferase family)